MSHIPCKEYSSTFASTVYSVCEDIHQFLQCHAISETWWRYWSTHNSLKGSSVGEIKLCMGHWYNVLLHAVYMMLSGYVNIWVQCPPSYSRTLVYLSQFVEIEVDYPGWALFIGAVIILMAALPTPVILITRLILYQSARDEALAFFRSLRLDAVHLYRTLASCR